MGAANYQSATIDIGQTKNPSDNLCRSRRQRVRDHWKRRSTVGSQAAQAVTRRRFPIETFIIILSTRTPQYTTPSSNQPRSEHHGHRAFSTRCKALSRPEQYVQYSKPPSMLSEHVLIAILRRAVPCTSFKCRVNMALSRACRSGWDHR